jgi:hypothetical protein
MADADERTPPDADERTPPDADTRAAPSSPVDPRGARLRSEWRGGFMPLARAAQFLRTRRGLAVAVGGLLILTLLGVVLATVVPASLLPARDVINTAALYHNTRDPF